MVSFSSKQHHAVVRDQIYIPEREHHSHDLAPVGHDQDQMTFSPSFPTGFIMTDRDNLSDPLQKHN